METKWSSSLRLYIGKNSIKNLNMSYRVVSIQPPKTKYKEHIRSYWESVMIKWTLAIRGFEAIYIDEFSISGHRSKFKSWSFKDVKSAIISSIDNFSMYFTLAVSEKHIYGVMSSEKANTAEVSTHFLSELIKWQYRLSNTYESKSYFIIDNASIHKTAEVRAYAERKWLNLLTIPSYSPALNGAETVIQAIKSKIKKRRSGGR